MEQIGIIDEIKRILAHIKNSRFRYNFSTKFNEKNYKLLLQGKRNDANGVPIKETLNCEGAAQFFMYLAKQNNIAPYELQIVKYPKAHFVPTSLKILGKEGPFTNSIIKGYEFSNHFRVKHISSNTLIDPTFGTLGNRNPLGLKLTSDEEDYATSIYAESVKINLLSGIGMDGYEDEIIRNMDLIEEKHIIQDDEWV